jgi:RNA polymerase sigma factor (sigma-70 family)
VDASPDPEAEALMREQFEALRHALADLPPADRLLVQLRFEQELTLGRIATMLGFKDPWVVHRQLDRVVKTLRSHLDAKHPPGSV